MDVGDRVMVPAALPWHSDFLEMRRFGSVPADLATAFIYRLLELRATQGAPSMTNLFHGNVPADLRKRIHSLMESPNPNKGEIITLTKNLEEILGGIYQRSGLELIEALSETAGVTVSLFNSRRSREASKTSTVDLAWMEQGTLFILYGSLTLDSFIGLPCGHFDVKYKYFQQAQCAAQNLALSYDQFLTIPFLSDCCSTDVRSSIADLLFQPQNKRELKRRPQGCYLCGKVPKAYISICTAHFTCVGCGIKSYFSDAYMRSPCCLQRLDESSLFGLHESSKNQYHLTSYFAKLKHQRHIEESLCLRESASLPSSMAGKQPNYPSESRIEQARNPARREQCQTCSRVYDATDREFQCPNACQCIRCSTETALRSQRQPCLICGQEFSENTRNRIKASSRRCHVCGISLPHKSFPDTFPCEVCLRCVEIVSTGTVVKARCRECKGKPYEIDKKKMPNLLDFEVACCNWAKGELFARNLKCGHPVCIVHLEALRLCRRCRWPTS